MVRHPSRKKIYKEILSRSKPRKVLLNLRKGKQHKGRRKAAGF